MRLQYSYDVTTAGFGTLSTIVGSFLGADAKAAILAMANSSVCRPCIRVDSLRPPECGPHLK
jgi:hypothetical protein